MEKLSDFPKVQEASWDSNPGSSGMKSHAIDPHSRFRKLY